MIADQTTSEIVVEIWMTSFAPKYDVSKFKGCQSRNSKRYQKMLIFDSKHVFYTFQVISHRFRRKKFFRPPKIFLSPSWPEKTKFSKKIKIRIFDSKCVFYTFQVISHRLRPKKFFRPPKIFRSPKHAFGAISNSQISKSTTNMNTSLLEPLEIIG